MMTLEEMQTRGITCASHPLNMVDRIVVEEIWRATIEICTRLDKLIGDNNGHSNDNSEPRG